MEQLIRNGLEAMDLLPQTPDRAPAQLAEYGRLLLEKKSGNEPHRHHRAGAGGPAPHAGQRRSAQGADFQDKTLIDVGTGAGFPGIPLKILVPSLQVTLLDSLNKRVDWLGQVCAQLGLEGIRAIHARAEEQALVKGFRDSFDFATARAVADLRLLCELCLPYVKVGGLFLAMKSTDSAQELEDAAHCIKLLGGRVEEPFDYAIPGAGVTHRVIPIRKAAPTLKGYPRRWAKIQKAPL